MNKFQVSTIENYTFITHVNDKLYPGFTQPPNLIPFQGFPQDKIIAGRSVFIAGHIAISG